MRFVRELEKQHDKDVAKTVQSSRNAGKSGALGSMLTGPVHAECDDWRDGSILRWLSELTVFLKQTAVGSCQKKCSRLSKKRQHAQQLFGSLCTSRAYGHACGVGHCLRFV